MPTKDDLLEELDFGSVDAESEEELAKLFVQTQDFTNISDEKKLLILGPKGSGKSAIFRLLTDYQREAKEFLGDKFPEDTYIIKATGGNDIQSVNDRSLGKLMREDGFSYERFWRIYIGLKIASKLGTEGYTSDGELGNVLRAFDDQSDWRIIPVFKTLWQKIVGDPPSSGQISYGKFSIQFKNDENLDIGRLLQEEQQILENNGRSVWLLLDRIDELRSRNPEERKELLEALLKTQIDFLDRFENIYLKIFLRTDIWSDLHLTNHSHLRDKKIRLEWNDTQLLKLINKRMLQIDKINTGIKESLSTTIDPSEIEEHDKETQENIFYSVFEDQVYSGDREANLFDWMTARIRDGHGAKYPRELISFCNEAKRLQRQHEEDCENRLIAGLRVRDAYYEVSKQRVNTYLSEFPDLDEHFNRFDGRNKPDFSHGELMNMFDDLEPSPDNAIKRMVDIGFFEEDRTEGGSKTYEIPRLYRDGIGLVLKGRP
jgi:energy-coupling factor transporter ATP-binding protein EcfA2